MLDAIKKFKKLIIGDTEGNMELIRRYKQMMKRAHALPKDYQYVFRKIRRYMTVHGVGPDGDLTIFTGLVDLFETSAADGKKVIDVIGSDVGGFCDELMRASVTYTENTEKLLGDPWDSRSYKQMMMRVNALPKDYQFAFRKIKHYMTMNGVGPDGELTIFTDLVDLFETSAADGKKVLDVVGSDVCGFCDELMRTSVTYTENTEKLREKLNKEVMEKFNKEVQ